MFGGFVEWQSNTAATATLHRCICATAGKLEAGHHTALPHAPLPLPPLKGGPFLGLVVIHRESPCVITREVSVCQQTDDGKGCIVIRQLVKKLNYVRARDYGSPGLELPPIHLAELFPQMRRHAPEHFRVPHYKWADRRFARVGVTTWDETVLLYNYARRLGTGSVLEIGSWVGWSTVALALGSSQVTAIDPLFAGFTQQAQSCKDALSRAGLTPRVRLVGDSSPAAIRRLSTGGARWDGFFVDGDHQGTAPLDDAMACAEVAPPDAIILFHDVIQENVGDALVRLSRDGWNCVVHCTSQFIGVATRGDMGYLRHIPDPHVDWERWIDTKVGHLRRFPLVGMRTAGGPTSPIGTSSDGTAS